ncbi:MAG: DNA glycosylase AlkZ-like family protein [Myxococcota bacterium]
MLLGAAGLGAWLGEGEAGVRAALAHLGCVQLDPIDRVGTNADLVAGARARGLARGDVHRHLRGRAFEHFAKERCLLEARFFPHYRDRAVETPWWRHSERMKKLDAGLVADVLAEVLARGPCTAEALADRGRVEAMDWAGWKGTSSATKLALEVLWTRCEVVVSARDARGRHVYDVPARALGAWADAPPEGGFGEEMLVARVRAAGLLSRAGGPMWSMLGDVRTDGTVERLLEAGRLVEVRIGRRPYLMLPEPPPPPPDDGALRVLGPLDSLLWDRALVREAFGFDYVWEIYKPATTRAWGYYVCPLLHRGALVGRLEGRRDGRTLVVETTWGSPEPDALAGALDRLAEANGCDARVGPLRALP